MRGTKEKKGEKRAGRRPRVEERRREGEKKGRLGFI